MINLRELAMSSTVFVALTDKWLSHSSVNDAAPK